MDGGAISLGEYLARWLEIAKPTVERTTWNSYEQQVRIHIQPHVGRLKLAMVSQFALEQFLAVLERAGISASRRRRVIVTLVTALRAAGRSRLIPHNVAADVDRPKVTKAEMHVLDPGQVTKLLEAAQVDRLFALYILALDSGMRQGELWALR